MIQKLVNCVIVAFDWCGTVFIHVFLTHWGRDKMDAISQTTFSSAFSWMKIFEFWLKFHWSLFPRVQLTIFQHWFRWWLGAVQATSHYLNQWWLIYRRIYASLSLNEFMYWAVSLYHAQFLQNIYKRHHYLATARSWQWGWGWIYELKCWFIF